MAREEMKSRLQRDGVNGRLAGAEAVWLAEAARKSSFLQLVEKKNENFPALANPGSAVISAFWQVRSAGTASQYLRAQGAE